MLRILLIGLLLSGGSAAQQLARLGNVEATVADFDGALLTQPDDQKKSLLSNPDAIGRLITDILVRRSIVADADALLDADEVDRLTKTATEETLAKLGVRYLVERNQDDLSVDIEARRLYKQHYETAAPVQMFDFYLVEKEVVDEGKWEDARAYLEEVRAAAADGIDDPDAFAEKWDISVNRHRGQREHDLSKSTLELFNSMAEGKASAVKAGPEGLFFLVLLEKGVAPSPTFDQVRAKWVKAARQQQRAQKTREILSSKSLEDVATEFSQSEVMDDAVVQAAIQLAIEEALLKAVKEKILSKALDIDVLPLAKERYLTNRSNYRGPETADIYAHFASGADVKDVSELIAKADKAFKSDGSEGLQQVLEEDYGFLLTRSQRGKGVNLALMDRLQTEAFENAVASGLAVGVKEYSGGFMIVAYDNYVKPPVKPFDEVQADIVDAIKRELEKVAWDQFKEPYYNEPLEADRAQISSLADRDVPDPIKLSS